MKTASARNCLAYPSIHHVECLDRIKDKNVLYKKYIANTDLDSYQLKSKYTFCVRVTCLFNFSLINDSV